MSVRMEILKLTRIYEHLVKEKTNCSIQKVSDSELKNCIEEYTGKTCDMTRKEMVNYIIEEINKFFPKKR